MFNVVAIQTASSHSPTFVSVMLFHGVFEATLPVVWWDQLQRWSSVSLDIYNCVSLGFSGYCDTARIPWSWLRQRLSSFYHLALSFLSCEKPTAWLIVVKVREWVRDVCKRPHDFLGVWQRLRAGGLGLAAPLCDPGVVWRGWGYH